MSSGNVPTLDYARPKLRVRLWLKRLALLTLFGFTAYLVYDKWWLWCRLQWQMLQAQRACLAYGEPPDHVVFDANTNRAAKLLEEGGYRTVEFEFFRGESQHDIAASIAIAPTWDNFTYALADLRWWDEHMVPPGRSGGGLFGGSGDKGMGPTDQFLISVHERRAAKRPRRLIAVWAHVYRDRSLRFTGEVLSVAGYFGRPEQLSQPDAPMIDDPTSVALAAGAKVLAPQADGADEATVVMPFYDANGKAGVVKATLIPDDHVDFRLVARDKQ